MRSKRKFTKNPLLKLFSQLGAVLVCLSFLSVASVTQAAPRELVFLNWSDYMDPDLIAEFEEQHGVKVKEIYFEHDEARDNILVEADGRGYDLAIVNGGNMSAYRQRG